MNWKSPRLLELEEQRRRVNTIQFRIDRHYRRMRSFSRVAREALVERDFRVALLAAGLPVPPKVSSEEKLARAIHWLRRDPKTAAAVLDKDLLRAARNAMLEAE